MKKMTGSWKVTAGLALGLLVLINQSAWPFPTGDPFSLTAGVKASALPEPHPMSGAQTDLVTISTINVPPQASVRVAISVLMTIKNVSTRALVDVYWTIEADNFPIGANVRPQLGVNESFDAEARWTPTTPGRHVIIFRGDPYNTQGEDETSRFNNTTSRSVEVPIPTLSNPPGRPVPFNPAQPYVWGLGVNPKTGATTDTSITFRAVGTGSGTPSMMVCKYEAVTTNGIASWQEQKDGCGEANTMLTVGTYKLRLEVGFKNPAGTSDFQTSEIRDYVVTPAPRFEVSSLEFEPAELVPGSSAKIHLKIKNKGSETLHNVPWKITLENLSGSGRRRDGSGAFKVLASDKESSVAPGDEFESDVTFVVPADGSIRITGEADPDNLLNEALPRRSDNKKQINKPVVSCTFGGVAVITPDGPRCVNPADAANCRRGPLGFRCSVTGDCASGFVCATTPCGGKCLRGQGFIQ